MKGIATLLSLAAFAAATALGGSAGAQPAAHRAGPTTTTADYTEQNLAGDQVVKFTGDELVGPPGGAYGDTIRRPPGVMRLGLIRPRMNFVSELLKSVENL
ncbi:MAG: hypothetical protein KIS78_30600 [Labilithrix sp.]|nr:hypothetical protein [Labilithrix sp.]MCW5836785.1 hypothetical protein [Labilithrix sp.]